MNRIYIRELDVKCIIGTEAWERLEQQHVLLNIMLECDFARACESDALEDTVDYKSLKDEIVELVEESSFLLIEKLAGEVARICLAHERVKQVRVTVDKPGALSGSRSVAVEIERSC
jgi:dihydroneopterin aldolase/D-erythro-7,8-dihydroneopterin triphosphate epimerase